MANNLQTKDVGAQLRIMTEQLDMLTGNRTRNKAKAAVTQEQLETLIIPALNEAMKRIKLLEARVAVLEAAP